MPDNLDKNTALDTVFRGSSPGVKQDPTDGTTVPVDHFHTLVYHIGCLEQKVTS